MEEAVRKICAHFWVFLIPTSKSNQAPKKSKQKGQALIEYLLILGISFGFAHFVFFNKEFGFIGIMNNGMLRLGTALEQNLKSGTKPGKMGAESEEPFAGTSNWNN